MSSAGFWDGLYAAAQDGWDLGGPAPALEEWLASGRFVVDVQPGDPLGADRRIRPSIKCGGPEMAPALPQSADNRSGLAPALPQSADNRSGLAPALPQSADNRSGLAPALPQSADNRSGLAPALPQSADNRSGLAPALPQSADNRSGLAPALPQSADTSFFGSCRGPRRRAWS